MFLSNPFRRKETKHSPLRQDQARTLSPEEENVETLSKADPTSYRREIRKGNAPSRNDDLVIVHRPEAPYVESMRALRSQLILRAVRKPSEGLVIPILSADRGVGKSFLAANLAAVFAHAGATTLLIDADFKNPDQHRYFRFSPIAGLAEILTGSASIESAHQVPGMGALSILASGKHKGDGQELLMSTEFSPFMELVIRSFEVTIIDTGAASHSADSQIIARRCNNVLLVARYGYTNIEDLERLSTGLETVGVSILGSVMTKFGTK